MNFGETIEKKPSHLDSFMDEIEYMDSDAWQNANSDYELRSKIADDCQKLVKQSRAKEDSKNTAKETIHSILEKIYAREFDQPDISKCDCDTQPILRDISSILEYSVLDYQTTIAQLGLSQINEYPEDGKGYLVWLKRLIADHPASSHPYYQTYLKDHGTREDIRFLLAQETSLDPRFDDILALMQLGTKADAKMELAANYWDEMGNGNIADMHTILFSKALDALEIDQQYLDDHYLFESKQCGNLSAALALSRRHYYKAIGYFGVTEYLAPRRFSSLITAWKRLGLPIEGAHYHELHIKIDAGHAASWFRNVISPAMDHDPRVGRDIAIGTLIRLNTSQQYLNALYSRTNTSNDY